MFQDKESSGKHMICDIKGIKNIELLNSKEKLEIMLREICDTYQFSILGTQHYNFEPQGCSILFLLSESHISIHTFPEKNHISFDIYTCRQYSNNYVYDEIYNNIIHKLEASWESTCKIIDRNF